MTPTYISPDLAHALHKAGAVPDNCFNIQLEISVTKPPIVTYSTYLDTTTAEAIASGLLNSIPTTKEPE